VQPAAPPTLVTTSARLYATGDDVPVTFHAPGQDGETVEVIDARHTIAGSGVVGGPQATGSVGTTDGTVTFSSDGWKPGAYDAILRDAGGQELARYPFWVQAAGTKTVVETDHPTYAEGDPIGISWHAAPGNRWDWVGIYRRGANPNVAYYLDWLYTQSTIDGSTVIDEDAHGSWPLKPGKYSVYLLVDDSYRKIAQANFTITP
jgi:hypothetical protein